MLDEEYFYKQYIVNGYYSDYNITGRPILMPIFDRLIVRDGCANIEGQIIDYLSVK